ncbi:glycosyltransferase [Aureisphaera galaxeae]|uniref:glycosyltransferase n=1 Tax=Aureisphaera galaxeae TaxID=1538023 RepID=UPI0023502991|nr:glycosyltransferase [Aureisphaera galaxeae]MDC8005683.1 glycosyltransferase [Aureisphaera galaxeae]
MKTGIIIPCYNEESRLDKNAFINFIVNHDDYHLCFVNDGSRDETLKVLYQMKSTIPSRISVVDIKKNVGKAAAVRAGVRFLYHMKDISNIGFMDADLSTDFRDFKDLVRTLDSDDKLSVVFGSRNIGGKGIKRDGFRLLLSNIIKLCICRLIKMPIRDTQCGAKVFTKSIIPVVYGNAFVSRWLFDVEIFLRLRKYLGSKNVMSRICEQPLMRWVHVEDSRLGLRDSIRIPFRLLSIWLVYSVLSNFQLIETPSEDYMSFEVIESPQLKIAA